MKFLFLVFCICCALFLTISAVPIEEAIPAGIEGARENVGPADDQSFLLKLVLLKKLLLG